MNINITRRASTRQRALAVSGKTLGALALVALAWAGCVPSRQALLAPVHAQAEARLGQRIAWRSSAHAGEVEKLLAAPLTADSAVSIALLNSAVLQAEFEELGVHGAAFAQAAAPENPEPRRRGPLSARRRWPAASRAARGAVADIAARDPGSPCHGARRSGSRPVTRRGRGRGSGGRGAHRLPPSARGHAHPGRAAEHRRGCERVVRAGRPAA